MPGYPEQAGLSGTQANAYFTCGGSDFGGNLKTKQRVTKRFLLAPEGSAPFPQFNPPIPTKSARSHFEIRLEKRYIQVRTSAASRWKRGKTFWLPLCPWRTVWHRSPRLIIST
jgi:hypothetical protein